MISVASAAFLALGTFCMIWGTVRFCLPGPLVVRIQYLGVSDTIGAVLVVGGLMLRFPGERLALGIALGALLLWGPFITFVLARGLSGGLDRGDRR
ncbi:MAG: monovalent cation/H(+) antiporter subunit G [Synergistales bacterium]|nr:monovalent cation/H(+) antiporter subunit G [Synergistales bacterium]